MDEIVPIQFINNKFQISIKKLTETHRSGGTLFYDAVTLYGTMCLIIENYSDLIDGQNTLQFLDKRNQLMKKYTNYFPNVYEQQISVNHPQQIICITLIQSCKHVSKIYEQIKDTIRISTVSALVRVIYAIESQMMSIDGEIQHNKLLWLNANNQMNMDFTKIRPNNRSKANNLLNHTVKYLQNLFASRYSSDLHQQIALIHDKIFKFNTKLLAQANDTLQLAIMLNALTYLKVDVQTKAISKSKNANQSPSKVTKVKSLNLNQLDGKQKIKINDKLYESFVFSQGKCINCYEQISYDQTKSKFVEENSYYKLQKLETLFIVKEWSIKKINNNQDIISIHPPVSKIQVINFLIAYLRWAEPIIKSISYLPVQNSLTLQFINKLGEQKKVRIIFYDEYVIKNEEISMIVQRAKLKDCIIDLRHMKINDAFLMFLANSQKTSKIYEIHLNDCSGITDNGINVMLISPFCKNMQALSLVFDDGLLASSMESLSLKSQLKKLHIQRSTHNNLEYQTKPQIDTSKLKLTQLSSIGIRVKLNCLNAVYLKVLRITQTVNLQQLKSIKNLALVQLKIEITQFSKKSIIESTSSFLSGALIGKTSSVKAFAEGPSHKTLKILDVSNSNARFKTLRPLFLMGELEKINLDSCQNLGNEYDHISPKILQISLANIQMQVQQLAAMVSKTPVLVQLNIINNETISKQQLVKFIIEKKKFINNLLISQHTFSNKLIQKMIGPENINSFELVENVHLYVNQILSEEQQHIFYYMIKKVSETPKILRIITSYGPLDNYEKGQQKKQILLQKIRHYIKVSNKKLKDFKNLYIDNTKYEELHKAETNNRASNNGNEQSVLVKNWPLYRLLSRQKIERDGNQIKLNVLQNETIDSIIHRLIKLINQSKQMNMMAFNMANNRLIGSQIIQMLLQYAVNWIVSINFSNCIFELDEVADQLFQFPYLRQVNRGQYSIKLNKHNFLARSQKYLKFFMKQNPVVRLTIDCMQVQQIQILYSVLYHIVDKHSTTIKSLKVHLNTLIINQQSQMFLQKIFDIQNLQQLQIRQTHCSFKYKNKKPDSLWALWQQGITKLRKLKKLVLKLPSAQYPQINNKKLQHIEMSFSDDQINEIALNKIIKHIPGSPLRRLCINLTNCKQISNLNKIFNAGPSASLLQKLNSLQHINLNLQHCNLKQQTVHQVLGLVGRCPSIKSMELNVSFAIGNISELVNAVNKMVLYAVKPMRVSVTCVTQNSSKYVMNHDYNNLNGIQYIL